VTVAADLGRQSSPFLLDCYEIGLELIVLSLQFHNFNSVVDKRLLPIVKQDLGLFRRRFPLLNIYSCHIVGHCHDTEVLFAEWSRDCGNIPEREIPSVLFTQLLKETLFFPQANGIVRVPSRFFAERDHHTFKIFRGKRPSYLLPSREGSYHCLRWTRMEKKMKGCEIMSLIYQSTLPTKKNKKEARAASINADVSREVRDWTSFFIPVDHGFTAVKIIMTAR
jgi:hypothetical protein